MKLKAIICIKAMINKDAIPVIVNGAYGKMGSLACEALEAHPEFKLVARLSREDSLQDTIDKTAAKIVIDLTRSDCVYANSLAIIEKNVHPVIGTSGLLETQINHLIKLCKNKKLGGIIAPNFSIGAVLMMQFSEIAARYLKNVEIIEMHHQQKYDAPSGTALKTAKMISSAWVLKGLQASKKIKKKHELLVDVRGDMHHGVRIHSLRLPGVMAKQEVIFGHIGETLTLAHESIDRVSYMPGLLLCCQKVLAIKSLYYGLEKVLEDD